MQLRPDQPFPLPLFLLLLLTSPTPSTSYNKQPFPLSDTPKDAYHSQSPYPSSSSSSYTHPAFLGRLHDPNPPGPTRNNPGGQPSISDPFPTPPLWVKPSQDLHEDENRSASDWDVGMQWSKIAGESVTLQVVRFEDEGILPRQECPAMVGPGVDGAYHCIDASHGYCDRRSGTCWCYNGHTGMNCSECDPFHHVDPTDHGKQSPACIPNALCPNDCSGAGRCNYTTGVCECEHHRLGPDCSESSCNTTHCETCDVAFRCTQCVAGFFLSIEGSCIPCTSHDPRCVECDEARCLACADPLLLSITRSGARKNDPPLPPEEASRTIPGGFRFGTTSPNFFNSASAYVMSEEAQRSTVTAACHHAKGIESNRSVSRHWSCEVFPQSHQTCGNAGVLSFSSATYSVKEESMFLRVEVQRSGGGFGDVRVRFALRHDTTDDSDVSLFQPRASLRFPPGVVRVSFLLRIHNDATVEPDETFQLHLYDPEGGAALGETRTATVTIHDDDFLRTSKARVLTSVVAPMVAGSTLNVSVEAFTATGRLTNISLATTEEIFLLALDGSTLEACDGRNCSITPTQTSANELTLTLARLGGLEARYQVSTNGQSTTRIDSEIDFLWGDGPVLSTASDYVTVEWTGGVISYNSQVDFWLDTPQPGDAGSVEVNGERIIHPLLPAPTARCTLRTDGVNLVNITYSHRLGAARARLLWRTSASSSSAYEIVPAGNLVHLAHMETVPMNVLPAEVDPEESYAVSAQGGSVTAGVVYVVDVFPRDRYQNHVHANPALFSASKGTLLSVGGEGHLVLRFTPTTAGMHKINLTMEESKQLHGFPLHLEVVPAQPDPSTTLVEIVSNTFIAGEPVTLVIHWFDAFMNAVSTTDIDLDIYVYAEGERFNAIVDAANRSRYAVVVTRAGPAKLYAFFRGEGSFLHDFDTGIAVSEREIEFTPASFVAARSEVSGNGLSHATAGQVTEVTLWAFDAFGNELNASVAARISIATSLQQVDDNAPMLFPCGYVERNQFNCSYIPTRAGNATLTLLSHVYSVHVSDGSAAASVSSADLEPFYHAGEPSNISLQLRDSAGNNRSVSEGNATVGCQVLDTFIPAVYVRQGRYALSFVARPAGSVPVACFIGSDRFEAFNLTIVSNHVSHLESGLLSHATVNDTRAGDPFVLTIQAKDAYGNDVKEPCFFELEADGMVVQGEHVSAGIHRMVYTAERAQPRAPLNVVVFEPVGLFTKVYANSRLHGEATILSPSQTRLLSSSDMSWRISTASLPDQAFASATATGFVRLGPEARFLRVRVQQGGVRVRVAAQDILHEWPTSSRSVHIIPLLLFSETSTSSTPRLHPIQIDFTAADQLTNASVSFSILNRADSGSTGIPLDIYQRRQLTTSPFHHHVFPNTASPQHSSFSIPTSTVAGAHIPITVTIRDAYRNLRPSCDDAVTVIAVHVPTLSSFQYPQHDCINGEYTLQPNLTSVGKWLIHTGVNPSVPRDSYLDVSHAVDGLHQIEGSPFQVLVSSAEPKIVEFSPVDGVVGVAGELVSFVIHVRDAFGNLRIETCDDVSVGSTRAASNWSQVVTCLGNGNYKVGLRTEKAGRFQASVRLDRGGRIDVTMEEDTAQPIVDVEFVYPITIRPAKPSATHTTLAYTPPDDLFTVTLRDTFGNGVAREQPSLVFTGLVPGNARNAMNADPVRRVVANGNGNYTAYMDTEAYVNASYALGLAVSLAGGHGLRSMHAVNGKDHVMEGVVSTVDITIDAAFVAKLMQQEPVGSREVEAFCQGTQLRWTGFVRADHDANYTFTLQTSHAATPALTVADQKGAKAVSRMLRAGLVYPIHATVSSISPGTVIKLKWAAETPEATAVRTQLPGTVAVTQHSTVAIPSEDIQDTLQQGDLLYIHDERTNEDEHVFTVEHYDHVFQRITLNASYPGASSPNATLFTTADSANVPQRNLFHTATPIQGSPFEDFFAQEQA